jgi:hypothetical protein
MNKEGGVSKEYRNRVSGVMCQRVSVANVLIAVLIGSMTAGCAAGTEVARGVLGVSTKILEDGRKDAVRKTVAHGADECFIKAEESLKKAGAYIYARNKLTHMMAVYVSETDTTPVGIFMTAQDNQTLVEVSSPSSFAKDFIAEKLFVDLERQE